MALGAIAAYQLSTPKPDTSPPQAAASPSGVADAILQALVHDAESRREQRRAEDPMYRTRVDEELNARRVNVLLYGYGESHEPPVAERIIIGSLTVASIDTDANSVSFVSLTHDIRAPEIERYLRKRAEYDGRPIRIDQAYPVGGFTLMREVMENATALSVDFQIAFRDTVIINLIDEAFGGVNVEIPADFISNPFYLDGTKFGMRRFSRGSELMDGKTVIQYIKTVPLVSGGGYYGRELEHNARKHLVFQAMVAQLQNNADPVGAPLKALLVLAKEHEEERIDFDFDLGDLFIDRLGLLMDVGRATVSGHSTEPMPEIEKTIYVVDSAHGDGGVQWVTASESPVIKGELALGRYPDRAMEVPLNANPYGELVTQYWPSVRSLVRRSLLGSRRGLRGK